MSDECLGLCDIDWEAGVCQGCGRATDEIFATPADAQPVQSASDDE